MFKNGAMEGIEEGIEEYIRQDTWQSEVGDSLLVRNGILSPATAEDPAPHQPRSERVEASARFNPLQSKEGTKVM